MTFNYQSPLGPIKIVAGPFGIKEILLQFGTKYSPSINDDISELSLDSDNSSPVHVHLRKCVKWFDTYFEGKFDELDDASFPDLDIPKPGTFSHNVWKCLCSVKHGQTITYKDLAELAGNPKASRAVGHAMKTNRLTVLVPCHRVIRTGGHIGNYSGGNGCSTKQWLLQHEKAMQ